MLGPIEGVCQKIVSSLEFTLGSRLPQQSLTEMAVWRVAQRDFRRPAKLLRQPAYVRRVISAYPRPKAKTIRYFA
jgi:hypothetical protein